MDEPKKLTVRQVKRAAKLLSRTGTIKYNAALNQIAREQGFQHFDAMRRHEEANPPAPPAYDFIVRVGSGRGTSQEEVGIWKRDLFEFHGIDEVEFNEARTSEKEMFVADFALWSKRRKGDFADYDVEVIKGITDDRPDFGLHWERQDSADHDEADPDESSRPGR